MSDAMRLDSWFQGVPKAHLSGLGQWEVPEVGVKVSLPHSPLSRIKLCVPLLFLGISILEPKYSLRISSLLLCGNEWLGGTVSCQLESVGGKWRYECSMED